MDNIKFYPEGWEFRPSLEAQKRKVYTIGTNDAEYATQIELRGKPLKCPAYSAWKGMLKRCYCDKYLRKYPNYVECSVVKVWHRFSNFRTWYFSQRIKVINFQGSLQVDKDILSNSRKYGPRTCLLITPTLNNFVVGRDRRRGKYPIGIRPSGRGYYAQVGGGDKRLVSKTVDTIEEAVRLRTQMKLERLDKIIPPWVDYDKVRRRCRKIIRNQK